METVGDDGKDRSQVYSENFPDLPAGDVRVEGGARCYSFESV